MILSRLAKAFISGSDLFLYLLERFLHLLTAQRRLTAVAVREAGQKAGTTRSLLLVGTLLTVS